MNSPFESSQSFEATIERNAVNKIELVGVGRVYSAAKINGEVRHVKTTELLEVFKKSQKEYAQEIQKICNFLQLEECCLN